MTIVLCGMCYSGKTTIGKLLAEKLNKNCLDSRDIFNKEYGMTETEYLQKYGRDKFKIAEEKSYYQNFDDMVISLAGSAIYYDNIMNEFLSNPKYTVIWLDVPLHIIEKRKKAEEWERPIVYPDGITTFEELFNERYMKYKKYHNIQICVTDIDTPNDVIDKIIKSF